MILPFTATSLFVPPFHCPRPLTSLSPPPTCCPLQARSATATWRGCTTGKRWGPWWCSTWRASPPSRQSCAGRETWTPRWVNGSFYVFNNNEENVTEKYTLKLIIVYLLFCCFNASISTSCLWQVALGNGRPVPAVLLANKCDQRGQGLCSKLPKLENFSKDHGFVGWYETSAKVSQQLC